ncbi:ABC transporter ATP-binding protein [Glutamicibacter sp.]|uniref:ABC transporter ATP-binding protein n=1 Tax=Glutamicibacter sp. TaxID=1931995 RepID=UPI0028BE31DB|nr:ABC transporter ATP-binding protein [Glutamicibacter sp.]
MNQPLIEVRGLSASLRKGKQELKLLDNVEFQIMPGRALGLVGESGSGKSLTTRAITRLLDPAFRVSGEISFRGDNVLKLNQSRLRDYRSTKVGMIFQDPRAHINPVYRVGNFLTEALVNNKNLSRDEAEDRAVSLLNDVGVRNAGDRLRQYPHELSGGLLQRVMIASVLLAEPELILADEPTTALDVTAQSDVMAIIEEQRLARGMSLLLITHDLELAAACCDDLAVMYAGHIVEYGPQVHLDPQHPYTKQLMDARPSIDVKSHRLPTLSFTRDEHERIQLASAQAQEVSV